MFGINLKEIFKGAGEELAILKENSKIKKRLREAKKVEAMQNPESDEFKRALAIAYRKNAEELPAELMAVLNRKYKEDEPEPEPEPEPEYYSPKPKPKPEPEYHSRTPEPEPEYHSRTPEPEDVTPIYSEKRGVTVIPKERGIAMKAKEVPAPSKPKSVPRGEVENVRSIIETEKLVIESIDAKSGCRGFFFDVTVEQSSVGKITPKLFNIIQNSLENATVTAEGNRIIRIASKTADFKYPIYTANYFHLLKKPKDYILGEVAGEVVVANASIHMGISGMSGSGKSQLLLGLFESLRHSTPNAEFYLISPKTDAGGGDFSKCVGYTGVKRVHVIDDTMDGFFNTMVATNEILTILYNKMETSEDIETPTFLFIDELAYLFTPVTVDPDDEQDVELERLQKKCLSKIRKISLLGRSKNIILILGTQTFTKKVFDPQMINNIGITTLKVVNGAGINTGFNIRAEDLLEHGDGLARLGRSVVNFQAPLSSFS